jgi:hypothetical protein
MTFFSGSRDTNILHFISDGRKWGSLTRKSPIRVAVCLFAFPFAFESKLPTLLEMQKASQI